MIPPNANDRIAALAALGSLILAVVALRIAGPLGVGFLGLLILFAAVRFDLEKEDVGGGFPSPSLYARQVAARQQMTAEERFAQRAGIRALWRPLVVARTIGIGLAVAGFGGYLFL
jgi:hypothetical protein